MSGQQILQRDGHDIIYHHIQQEEFIGANGVKVKLDGPQSVVTTTDNNGYFKFTGLTPGSYSLTTESVNYENLVINGIEIEAGKTFNIVSEAGIICASRIDILSVGRHRQR